MTASRESMLSMSMCRCAPRVARRAQQRSQALGRVEPPEVRSVGAQQRRQRGDLHGQVHARRRSARVGVEQRARIERRVDAGELVERGRAACRVAVGLGRGHRRLAEQVDGRGDAVAPQRAQHAARGVRGLADDEAVRHPLDAGRGRRAERRAPGARGSHAHRDLDRRRRIVDVVEERRQMAREVVERAAGGHDVDEAKQRGAQLLVLGGELHRAVVERAQRSARTLRESGGEAPPDGLDLWLDLLRVHHGDDTPGRPGQHAAGPGRSLRDLRDAHRRRGRRADRRRPGARHRAARARPRACSPMARWPTASGPTGHGRARPRPAPSPRARPTRPSSAAGPARGRRSPRTRSRASAPRCAPTARPPRARGAGTTPTCSRCRCA